MSLSDIARIQKSVSLSKLRLPKCQSSLWSAKALVWLLGVNLTLNPILEIWIHFFLLFPNKDSSVRRFYEKSLLVATAVGRPSGWQKCWHGCPMGAEAVGRNKHLRRRRGISAFHNLPLSLTLPAWNTEMIPWRSFKKHPPGETNVPHVRWKEDTHLYVLWMRRPCLILNRWAVGLGPVLKSLLYHLCIDSL